MNNILGFNYIEQINDEKNDIIIYEIKRFLQLLESNNPTVLELLNTPDDCVKQKKQEGPLSPVSTKILFLMKF